MHRLAQNVRSNAVAYLALFVALGGTGAYAAGEINSRDIANNSVKGKDLKDDSTASRDLKDGAVSAADLADGSVTAAAVQDASLGGGELAPNSITGAAVDESSLAGNPRVVAQVDQNGDVLFAEGLGGATVSHPIPGTYCFNNLEFAPQVIVASPTSFVVPLASAYGPTPGCPDADATVVAYDPQSATATDSRFYVFIR